MAVYKKKPDDPGSLIIHKYNNQQKIMRYMITVHK